jgi:hypothetical protein
MSSIDKMIFKQLALSLNHQNAGEEKVPYLSIAYTADTAAGALSEEILDGYLGKFTYRSWFNINGNDIQPMDWVKRGAFKLDEGFQDVPVTMLKGKKELEFDGCRLYFDRFRLMAGGLVLPDFHIHVIDHSDQDMITVRKWEFSEVTLSLGAGVLIERKARKQRQLPFEGGEDVGGDIDTSTPLTGAHLQRDETLVYWQHGTSGDRSCGKRCDMPAGCVEIDPPSGGKSEREQLAAQNGSGQDDTGQFENGLAAAVGAHKKRGSNVIDGRSERVKHEDRRAGRDDTH